MKIFRLLNQRGLSLVEITVSGGILAGLAVAGTQIIRDYKQQQAYFRKLQKLDNFHQTLSKNLQQIAHCNATFSYWAVANLPQVPNPPGNDIRQIHLCLDGGPGLACDDKILATQIQANALLMRSPPVISEASLNLPSQWIDPVARDWRVRDIGIPEPLRNSGRANLSILYELNGSNPLRTKVKTIPLNFKFSGPIPAPNNRFVTCTSEKEANIRTAAKDLCESLGSGIMPPGGYPAGVPTSKRVRYARWDSLLQRCLPEPFILWNGVADNCNFANYSTTPTTHNDMITGLYPPNGTDFYPPCRPALRGISPNDLVDRTPMTCAPPASHQVIIGADGKLSLGCL